MKKTIHSETEMVKAVQELESGIDAETVARDHGISTGRSSTTKVRKMTVKLKKPSGKQPNTEKGSGRSLR